MNLKNSDNHWTYNLTKLFREMIYSLHECLYNFFSKNHCFDEIFVIVTFRNFHIHIDNKNNNM